MMKQTWVAALLALSLLTLSTTALAAEGSAGVSLSGEERLTSTETPVLKAQGGEGNYTWYYNGDELKRPLTNMEIEATGATDEEKAQMRREAAAQRAALLEQGFVFSDDGSSLTAERSGDYYVSSGALLSEKLRISREFDSRNSSSLVIGKRSNTLATRKDSQIEKLEARVAQAAADAENPLPNVTLGAVYTAVSNAATTGGVVTLNNAGLLEPAIQTVLMRRIGENGLDNRLYSDTVLDKKVVTRLALTPSLATSPVDLRLAPADAALTERLGKSFSNMLVVLEAGQQGAYGQTVSIMVHAPELAGEQNLCFYRFDSESNRCSPITVSGISFDQNGYLHFNIGSGGILVISVGELAA